MTTYDSYSQEAVWQDDEWYLDEEEWGYEEVIAPLPPRWPPELVMFGAVGLILLLGVVVLLQKPMGVREDGGVVSAESAEPVVLPFAPLYDDYVITQGPHGMSYGHYAIDLAAGAGAPIYAPIDGVVTALYVDGIGNPTLVIENEQYSVTFLHGDYIVTMGQAVTQSMQLGTESNKGNVTDMAGNSCRNRNCGYHTHLNVFDKTIGTNVNPLDLFDF